MGYRITLSAVYGVKLSRPQASLVVQELVKRAAALGHPWDDDHESGLEFLGLDEFQMLAHEGDSRLAPTDWFIENQSDDPGMGYAAGVRIEGDALAIMASAPPASAAHFFSTQLASIFISLGIPSAPSLSLVKQMV